MITVDNVNNFKMISVKRFKNDFIEKIQGDIACAG